MNLADRNLAELDSGADADEAILLRRALELAKAKDTGTADSTEEILVFDLRQRHFCARLAEVFQIVPLAHITKLPNSPKWVAGITHFQGNILILVDVSDFVGVVGDGISDRRYLIVVGDQRPEFGILVDRADEVRHVDTRLIVRAQGDDQIIPALVPGVGELVDMAKLVEAMVTSLESLVPSNQPSKLRSAS